MKGGGVFFDLLYPPRCVGCDFWFAWGRAGWWCDSCEQERVASGPFEREIDGVTIYSAHHYTCEPVATAVHTIKYQCAHGAAQILAQWLVPLIAHIQNEEEKIIVIPVPLHARREAERGFNQASVIARELCKQLKLQCDETLLHRSAYTKAQAQSDGALRAEQLQNAFHATRMCEPDVTYILLDDVITTGSTLKACVSALRSVGAVHITGVTIATTQ